MKRIFTFLLAISFVGLVSAQDALVNGDFETWDNDNEPTGWTHIENITKETTEVHTAGGTSAKHVGGTKDLGQLINGIIAGREYVLTIWYKVVEGDGTDARLWSKWSTGGTFDHETDKVLLQGPGGGSSDYLNNNGGEWTKYSATVTAPDGVDEFYFEVRTYSGATTYWDDFSFVLQEETGNSKPVITNVTMDPMYVSSSDAVTVSADITDADGTIVAAGLNWGTEPGVEANKIVMTKGEGDSYSAVIPAQADGVKIYYTVGALDDVNEGSVSGEKSYTVRDAKAATLPYMQGFDTDMGDFYAVSKSGDSKYWGAGSFGENGYMYMNGFNSGDVEMDYLITPAFDMSETANEVISYKSWRKYGSDDADNHMKLFYSTDYAGVGDVSLATWTEISEATFAVDAETWTETTDLAVAMDAASVHFAFVYNYSVDSYVNWQIDDVSVKEGTSSALQAAKSLSDIYAYGNTLVINSEVNVNAKVYNLAGQMVRNLRVESGRNEFQIAKSGIYLIKLNNSVQKVVIR